jgi:hypothetical protein
MEQVLILLKNKYFQVIAAILIALVLGFTSGYSYKADKVELERLQQFEIVQTKLDKIYKFSQAEADKAKESDLVIAGKLGIIISGVKGKPLSSIPCTPSEDFSTAWRSIDNVTKELNN